MADVFFSKPEIVIGLSWPRIVVVILKKFGMLIADIDTDLLKKVTSSNPNPEVKLRYSGRHLENRHYIIIPPTMVQFV